MLNVHSIFKSIDGEANGFWGCGQPTLFIRLRGCNLRCWWCDTEYAQTTAGCKDYQEMSLDSIMKAVDFSGFRKVTLTGGEPLYQGPQVIDLLSRLVMAGRSVTVETNGSILLSRYGLSMFPREARYSSTGMIDRGCVRFAMDYKLPSSGMTDRMVPRNFPLLTEQDVVKFVIADEHDFQEALAVIDGHSYCKSRWVFSPAINLTAENPMAWPAELAETIINSPSIAGRIQFSLQIHKVLWPGAGPHDER